jgi:light-harvesting complex I chlorophyll a/b binding protein 1
MFAVVGYSVGRTPTQSPVDSHDADVEMSALALAGFPTRPSVARRAGDVAMATSIKPGDVGTTRPLGVYDPLGLMTKNPEKYRRFQEMEIKHGRIAMLAVLHVIVTGAGYRWAGYCSYLSFPPLKFEDIPGGTLASWEALPQAGWAQIVAVIAILDNSLFAQDPDREPGDVVGDRIPWVRYSDPAVREYKLNAERNNGRAAMMGIIGMMIHEGLTGNPIWPIDYEPGSFPLIPLEAVWPGIFSMGNPYPTA